MAYRPNSLNTQDVAMALATTDLFVMGRDYFGAADEAGYAHSFECPMEFDAVSGRLEFHLFTSLQDGSSTPPLVHLIAHRFEGDGIAPSVLELDGETLNARRMPREAFRMLLKFVGEARFIDDREAYISSIARFRTVMAPALREDIQSARCGVKDQISALFQTGEAGFPAAI